MPAAGRITETDDAGREILSHVPISFVADFMSGCGQSLVSRPKLYQFFSVLMNNQNNPRLTVR